MTFCAIGMGTSTLAKSRKRCNGFAMNAVRRSRFSSSQQIAGQSTRGSISGITFATLERKKSGSRHRLGGQVDPNMTQDRDRCLLFREQHGRPDHRATFSVSGAERGMGFDGSTLGRFHNPSCGFGGANAVQTRRRLITVWRLFVERMRAVGNAFATKLVEQEFSATLAG